MHTNSMYEAFTASPKIRVPPYCLIETSEELIGDDSGADDFGQPLEKKRRLSIQQVKTLEKNFELENKLDAERKVQLAWELGLQPRQVAVWFQNRRARWKTKQLEKDYDTLKADYDALKADLNVLLQEKKMLQAQVLDLNLKLYQEDEIMLKFKNRKVYNIGLQKIPETSLKVDRAFELATMSENLSAEIKQKTSGMRSSVSGSCKILPLEVKEGSSSSDSDDSEILDVENTKDGGDDKSFSPMHHQIYTQEILALEELDKSLIHIHGSEEANDNLQHQPYSLFFQRGAVKLEDVDVGVSTEENCNGFLSNEDQARAFSCWDWS